MNRTPYTLGPWELKENADAMFGHYVLAKTRDQHPNDTSRVILSHTHDLDTARLIAAAPELLEACQELDSYLDLKLIGFRREYPENHCIVQTAIRLQTQVRAAIGKAIGQ